MRLIDAEPLVKLLHSRCAQLSNDYGSLAGAVSGCLRLLQSQPTISALINEPLTQEELRKMDGKPVWVEIPEGRVAEWCIAKWDPLMGRIRLWGSDGGWFDGRNCEKSVFVYRLRLEDGKT